MAFFAGPVAALLWIGAGRLAVLVFVLPATIVSIFSYIGFPALPIGQVALIAWLGFAALSVVVIAPLAEKFRPDRWYSHGLVILVFVLVSYLAAFGIRSFLLQPFSMPSGSMYPSLQVGDYFFANKMAYGYGRYSVPFELLPDEGRLLGKQPQRGDVVVLRPAPFPQVDYVERIVGLPGETVQMIAGRLHIDGQPVQLEEIGPYESEEFRGVVQRETLPNGVSYLVLDLHEGTVGDDTAPFAIPPGQYFAMGDNRDNSSDSRFTLGFVPWENLVGRAEYIYWNANGVPYGDRQGLRPQISAKP